MADSATSAIFRLAYGERHTAKRIARDLGVALATGKGYLTGRLPPGRREQIFAAIEARLEDRLAELARAELALDALRAGHRRE